MTPDGMLEGVVTSKQARVTGRFLGGLCLSGLLMSLSLLCSLDADVWKKFLSRPALPFILRLLRGLAIQHPATQVSGQHARGLILEQDMACEGTTPSLLISHD